MLYGVSSLMMNFYMPALMALLSNALMGLSDEFIQEFSLILLIILKSLLVFFIVNHSFDNSLILLSRVLLACIRENGLFPCHRCLIPKSFIYQLGLADDIAFRINNVRSFLADQVTKARNSIYKRAKPINGTDVEDLLKETSSVPTMVRHFAIVFTSVIL